jgi:hypothetical protein
MEGNEMEWKTRDKTDARCTAHPSPTRRDKAIELEYCFLVNLAMIRPTTATAIFLLLFARISYVAMIEFLAASVQQLSIVSSISQLFLLVAFPSVVQVALGYFWLGAGISEVFILVASVLTCTPLAPSESPNCPRPSRPWK